MSEVGKLKLPDGEIDLPVVVGTEGERSIDITKLRAETGAIRMSPSLARTGP